MALFGKKTKEKKLATDEKVVSDVAAKAEEKKESLKPAVSPLFQTGRNLASVILKPRITEKAAYAIDRNVYTFIVRKDATKHSVRDAIRQYYNVTPTRINIVNKKPRHYTSRMRGRDMMEKGMKKAYVYLKEGDRIDLT